MTIKVLFTTSNSFLSRSIRFVTGSEYSHVAIVVDDIVYESQKEGIIAIPYELYSKYNPGYHVIDVYEPIFDFNHDNIISDVNSLVYATKYDFVALLKHVLYKTTGYWRKRRNSEKRMTCSEFVSFVFYRSTSGLLFKDWWKLSPAKVHESGLFDYVCDYHIK